MINHLSSILLAGGTGSRMGGAIPKQFRTLGPKRVIDWSLSHLLRKSQELIVVADKEAHSSIQAPLFALPGARRQDSCYNGFLKSTCDWILVHDAARPFIEAAMIDALFEAAQKTGAAALALPCEATVRQITEASYSIVDRNGLFLMQTPQILHRDIMALGFLKAHTDKLTVTDDVALAELVGYEIALVMSDKKNIKLTTEEDFSYAEFLASRMHATL